MITNTAPDYSRQFVAKYTLEAGDIDQIGYATISNTGSLGAFTGATVPAIASATYDLDVTIDGGGLNQLAVALLNTDDWDGIAAKIQTALRTATGSTETVAIVAGKIQITSATAGSTSTVLIAAGTAGSGGGDLLAAITALGATYTATLDTPVDGTEASVAIVLTDVSTFTDFVGSVTIDDSTDVQKIATIRKVFSSGTLTISDTTTTLAAGDKININGALV